MNRVYYIVPIQQYLYREVQLESKSAIHCLHKIFNLVTLYALENTGFSSNRKASITGSFNRNYIVSIQQYLYLEVQLESKSAIHSNCTDSPSGFPR